MIRTGRGRRSALPVAGAVLATAIILALDPLIRVGPREALVEHTVRILAHLSLAAATGFILYAGFDRLLRSVERYRMLARSMRELAVFVKPDGTILDVNRAAVRTYGWTRSELVGEQLELLCAQGGTGAVLRSALHGGGLRLMHGVHRRRDGSTFPVEMSASRGVIRRESVLVIVARDITERRRREAFEKLLHEIDRRTLSGGALDNTLAFVAEGLAELFAQSVVQITLEGDDGAVRIRHVAGEGSAAFGDGMSVRWDDTPAGRGPTGAAIRTGEVRVSFLPSDRDFLPWRDRALEHGFRCAVAIPLTAHRVTLGALTLFTRHDGIDAEEIESLQGFADQVAITVHSAQTLEQLALQRVALESAANAILISDASGRILWVNPAFTTLTGHAFEEVVGQSPRILKSGNHGEAFYRQMWTTLAAGHVWQGEIYNRRRDGTRYLEEQTITPVRGTNGEVTHFVAIKLDITARKKQEERIHYLAMHDALTGLANRRLFAENLARVVHQARRGRHGALMLIDIDNFKLVNDSLGHGAGDQLLKEFAAQISLSVRGGDLVARMGGDEFAVLLEGADLPAAFHAAQRFHADLDGWRFAFGGQVFDVGASIGIATIDGSIDADTVTVHADSALYSAKEHGKNRVAAYDAASDWSSRFVEAGQWAARIREALRSEGFELCYQPVVNLNTGRAGHYEALIRLRDDDGSLITAERFLRAAERFGLMPQIDRWVIERVTELLGRAPDIAVFVNLAAASLSDESLLDLIAERLERFAIAPGRLAFEITETAAITDMAKAQAWIRRVKDLGCLFALDDFGIGFSSLAYLRGLSVDYVKIDRSFVSDVHVDSTSRALVQAVSAVALTLGKEVIAEGVECEEHAAVLREIGIEHGQGFLWGEPRMFAMEAVEVAGV